MKTLLNRLIFIILFLNISLFSYSQNYWTQLYGPYGGEVINVQKNFTGNLFALRDEGIYVSNNNADSWSKLPEVFDNNNLCMDISPSGIIYVGKSSGGIWWTANNGQSWSFNPVNVAPHSGLWASIVIAKVNPAGHIYINSYVSFNGGTTFSPIAIGSPERLPADYVFNGSASYAATNNGVYHSANNGSSWTTINGNLPSLNATSLMTDNNILIAGINGSGVYKTTNNGTTWEAINNGITDLNISKVYRDSQNNYFAGTLNGKVFKSVDAGASWTEIYSSENGNKINSISSDAGILYLSTKNYGVLQSINSVTWNEKNNNLFLSGLRSIAFSAGGDIFAAGYYGIQYSSDNGLNWQNRSNGLPSKIVNSVYVTQDQSLLAGIQNMGMYRSSDKGISWFASSNGISNGASIKEIKSSSDGTLFAANIPNLFQDTLEIYKSSDNGFTWIEILQPQSSGMSQFTIDAAGNLYVAGFNPAFQNSLLSSTDGGNTWNENTLGQFLDLQNLTASGQNIYISSGLRIHYSSNRGVTWNMLNNGNWSNSGFTTIGVNSMGHIFASINSKVFLTTNTGVSWSQKNSGITQNAYIEKFIFNNTGFVFGLTYYSGIFKSAQSTITHTNNNVNNLPEKFSLTQNYPNPFNPITKINFDLSEDVRVKLIVYDLLGREVMTLVNNEFRTTGKYSVVFNGMNIASGIYFYRLEAGDFVETKRMVLIK